MAINGAEAIAIIWVAAALSLTFVCLRIYVRWFKQHSISPSDFLVILAWLIHVTGCSLDTRLYTYGFIVGASASDNLQHNLMSLGLTKIPAVLKIIYWTAPVQYTTLWAVKGALILLYYQFFPVHMRYLRWVLHLVALFTAMGYVVVMGLNFFWCHPIDKNWNVFKYAHGTCLAASKRQVYYPTLGIHAASDFFIYVLPFFLLPTLKLSRRKMLGIAFIFSLGTVSLACVAGRALEIKRRADSVTSAAIWIAWEQSVGIIVCCCPAVRHLIYSSRDEMEVSAEVGPSPAEPPRRKIRNPMDDLKTGTTTIMSVDGDEETTRAESISTTEKSVSISNGSRRSYDDLPDFDVEKALPRS